MFFFFQAEDGIRDVAVTGVQTCALPIYPLAQRELAHGLVHHLREVEQRDQLVAPGLEFGRGDGVDRLIELKGLLGRQVPRSEERRVGKEWRSRRWPSQRKEVGRRHPVQT